MGGEEKRNRGRLLRLGTEAEGLGWGKGRERRRSAWDTREETRAASCFGSIPGLRLLVRVGLRELGVALKKDWGSGGWWELFSVFAFNISFCFCFVLNTHFDQSFGETQMLPRIEGMCLSTPILFIS